jgi:predicted MarR family transcription regulator
MSSRSLQMARQKIAEVDFILHMAYKVFQEWQEIITCIWPAFASIL